MIGAAAGFHLDAEQYTVLWRRLGGEKPLVLATPDHGTVGVERDRIDAAARRRSRAAGHTDADDVPTPALSDLLDVLARPDAELDVRVWSREGLHATTACVRGELAVVAALDDDRGLRLAPATPATLPESLLAAVPEAPAAVGSPMTVPARALAPSRPEADPTDGWAAGLRRAGVPAPTARRLLAIGAAPARRRLQFGVARRDREGRRCRGETLDVVDTVEGRVALRRVGTQLLVRPADRSWLRDELTRMLAAPPVPRSGRYTAGPGGFGPGRGPSVGSGG